MCVYQPKMIHTPKRLLERTFASSKALFTKTTDWAAFLSPNSWRLVKSHCTGFDHQKCFCSSSDNKCIKKNQFITVTSLKKNSPRKLGRLQATALMSNGGKKKKTISQGTLFPWRDADDPEKGDVSCRSPKKVPFHQWAFTTCHTM